MNRLMTCLMAGVTALALATAAPPAGPATAQTSVCPTASSPPLGTFQLGTFSGEELKLADGNGNGVICTMRVRLTVAQLIVATDDWLGTMPHELGHTGGLCHSPFGPVNVKDSPPHLLDPTLLDQIDINNDLVLCGSLASSSLGVILILLDNLPQLRT